jgi:hypothetical protein
MVAPRLLSSAVRGLCLALLSGSLVGCNLASTASSLTAIPISGNWQFSSKSPNAAGLPSIAGTLSGTSLAITGILHANTANACLPQTQTFAVKGVTGANNSVLMTSDNVAGGILSITGTLAPDGKSMSNVSYTVSGGTCEFDAAADDPTTMGTSYTPINGNYTGNFVDSQGDPALPNFPASFTQSNSDGMGNYQLSGSATFTSNLCIASPASITNSQVSGGNINFTYTDASGTSSNGNQVMVTGTSSTDGKTLTVNWVLSGSGFCDGISGTGTLTSN